MLTLIIQVSHTPRHDTPVKPEYLGGSPLFTRQVNLYPPTGTGNADGCIAWSGARYGLFHSSSKPPSMNNRGLTGYKAGWFGWGRP